MAPRNVILRKTTILRAKERLQGSISRSQGNIQRHRANIQYHGRLCHNHYLPVFDLRHLHLHKREHGACLSLQYSKQIRWFIPRESTQVLFFDKVNI